MASYKTPAVVLIIIPDDMLSSKVDSNWAVSVLLL